MRETQDRRLVSVPAMLITTLAAACVTWLSVGWLGTQGPLGGAAVVVLAELFLACCGAVALLLTARFAEAYLRSEVRAEAHPPRRWQFGLWKRLWQPARQRQTLAHPVTFTREPVDHWLRAVYNEMRPVEAASSSPATIPFQSRPASGQSLRCPEPDTNRGDHRSHRRAA